MEKQRWKESDKWRAKERRSEKRKSEKKEDAGERKGSKVAKHCVFPLICGSGGSKSRLAKAAGAEPCGQMRDEKLLAVVAQSTFPSQNVQTTPCSDQVWKLTCRKNARRSKTKVLKTEGLGPLLDERWIFHGRRRDRFIRDVRTVRRSGHWFPETGCILEHQIFSFGKMILRDRCSTSYDLASLFRGKRNTSETWTAKSQNALVRGRQLCTQVSIIEGSLAELLWGNLAELLCFDPLNTSKIEQVSQNSFVFKLADGQIDRQTATSTTTITTATTTTTTLHYCTTTTTQTTHVFALH